MISRRDSAIASFSKYQAGRMPFIGPIMHCLAGLFAMAMLLCLATIYGCASLDETSSLERPASIAVYFNGIETEYAKADSEYSLAFDLLKRARLRPCP